MKTWRIASIVLTIIAAAALVGSASAQDDPSVNPTPQPGQHFNFQGQYGQNNNQTPQGDPKWRSNGRGQPGSHNGQDNPWSHRDGRYGDPRGQWRGYNGFPYSPPTTQITVPQGVISLPSQATVLNHIVQIVAQALNVPTSTLTSQMSGGMTLTEIITADGGTVTMVTSQIITGLTTWLDGDVSDGLVTQTRANQIFSDLSNIVQRALTGAFTQSNGVVQGLILT